MESALKHTSPCLLGSLVTMVPESARSTQQAKGDHGYDAVSDHVNPILIADAVEGKAGSNRIHTAPDICHYQNN